MSSESSDTVSITPLLKRLWPEPATENVTAAEIATALSHIFTNSLSHVQTGALLTALHFTGWDRKDDVIAKCAAAMREAAAPIERSKLRAAVRKRGAGRREGRYLGGLCDIVGTGGDSHNTFNVSTTSSILASSLLLIGKHGNRASTSRSGSADLIVSLPSADLNPTLSNITPDTLMALYEHTNYAFLFAPYFHPGMKYVAPVRKELGWRTIFNLLGPLSNPADCALEARVVGVARSDLGSVFASALRMAGVKKAMVVCGEEELDEISCAGGTSCWMLEDRAATKRKYWQDGADNDEEDDEENQEQRSKDVEIIPFRLTPEDFGLPSHPLSEVGPGRGPEENAVTLLNILKGDISEHVKPILDFVLMNTAALLVTAGVCEADESHMGEGDDGKVITERGPGGGRWKEGVRRAMWAVKSGAALREWEGFVQATRAVGPA